MAALQYVDVPQYAALILRREYPMLQGADGLISRAHAWLHNTDAAWNEQQKKWTFPSGAVLQFGHAKDENDKYRYQGQAFQFVGFDELTHFTESQYDYIGFTRARRSTEMERQGVPIRTRATGNPGGLGHIWVKERFITARKQGVIYVPARVWDNPGLDADNYVGTSLAHLPDDLRKQLLEGDWDAFEGAAFTIDGAHRIDRFELRDAHDRFEACDYGLNGSPWGLWAVDFEGNLIVHDLLYERDLLPSELAPLVIAKRKSGWGHGHRAVADPSIWHRTGTRNKFGQPAMLADEFTDHGVPLDPANNDPRAGMMRLRELLKLDPDHRFPSWHERAGEPGAPRLFFARGPVDRLVEELRAAPLQEIDKRDGGEIISPEWESRHGHSVAMARYAVLTRPAPSKEPPAWTNVPPHLRKEWDLDPAQQRRDLLDRVMSEREKAHRPKRRTERV